MSRPQQQSHSPFVLAITILIVLACAAVAVASVSGNGNTSHNRSANTNPGSVTDLTIPQPFTYSYKGLSVTDNASLIDGNNNTFTAIHVVLPCALAKVDPSKPDPPKPASVRYIDQAMSPLIPYYRDDTHPGEIRDIWLDAPDGPDHADINRLTKALEHVGYNCHLDLT